MIYDYGDERIQAMIVRLCNEKAVLDERELLWNHVVRIETGAMPEHEDYETYTALSDIEKMLRGKI